MEQSLGGGGLCRCLGVLGGALLLQGLSGLLGHGLSRRFIRHRWPLDRGGLVGPDHLTLPRCGLPGRRYAEASIGVGWGYADALPSSPSIGRWSARPCGFSNEPTPFRTAGSTGHLMAIADIGAYAHLSDADIENLGRELDAIRSDIEESLGERDAAYIRRTIGFQRTLDVAARLLIACTRSRAGWAAGDRVAGLRQERREHGDRPQRRPWSMGLDERPGDPLEHLGVGHGRPSRRSGGIRTTTATTCSATSSAWTTTSASA